MDDLLDLCAVLRGYIHADDYWVTVKATELTALLDATEGTDALAPFDRKVLRKAVAKHDYWMPVKVTELTALIDHIEATRGVTP
ncbi:hypothetical protein [Aeromicrobium sp. 179-A 4D2 NHS]|uniref:hypothetical protein n=1 Tax=Aeromicrobium sp. 179-A 4D2 NHS TaxID=3142375 RepID=UPI00399EFBB1